MASAIPAAAVLAGAVAEPIAKHTAAFLDRDVIAYSKEKTITRVSENGRREVEEKTVVSAGVKVWEVGLILALVAVWEMVQIVKEDVTQLQTSGSWITDALEVMSFGLLGGAAVAAVTPKPMPSTNGMSAMAILDAQVGLAVANIGGILNASGGQLLSGLFAQFAVAQNAQSNQSASSIENYLRNLGNNL